MSTNILKIAYELGYKAFSVFDTTKDERGQMRGWPNNPYQDRSLPYKEWQRGFNGAYFDNLKKAG